MVITTTTMRATSFNYCLARMLLSTSCSLYNLLTLCLRVVSPHFIRALTFSTLPFSISYLTLNFHSSFLFSEHLLSHFPISFSTTSLSLSISLSSYATQTSPPFFFQFPTPPPPIFSTYPFLLPFPLPTFFSFLSPSPLSLFPIPMYLLSVPQSPLSCLPHFEEPLISVLRVFAFCNEHQQVANANNNLRI